MEYNRTVNLPRTNFQMKANLPQMEPAIQKKWDEMDIYGLMQKANRGKPLYVLHDGPPYANGRIHMGHALNKILKDIIVKFKSMQGFSAPYVPGWDCHGLPIEYQLLKDLALTKNQISQLELRKKAYSYAGKYVEIQMKEFKRLGIFGDWKEPYLTMSFDYEAGIIDAFARLVERGYVYRKKKPVYWCCACETALAEAEVEYAEKISNSIYVKFPVKESKQLPGGTSILIWTTTPWTLPGNVAVAFHPDYEYAVADSQKGILVMAKSLLDTVSAKLGIKSRVIKELKGRELEGMKCANPLLANESLGICADFVTLEDGTGVVHIAPGHGEDDYRIGQKYGLDVVSPVDEKGRFTDEVKEIGGMGVFESNKKIIEELKKTGMLLFSEDVSHSYPHCWRCKSPVIFRATEQWFLSVDKNGLRKKLLGALHKVKWIPAAGENRISSMIETRPDWCLSRQRYWGVPIPAFYCKSCGETLLSAMVMESFRDIVRKEGSNAWFTKKTEEILPAGIKCTKCGKSEFEKEKDILDVWFDSGVSYEAVLKHRKGLKFPADLYLEGSDQHRGWFQTSLIPSVALENKPPYGAVLTHGFTVDGQGKKMSKSMGNVIAPQEVMDKYGADILRLWVASGDYSEDIRISDEIISHLVDAYRRFRNTFKYLLGNLDGFDLPKRVIYNKMPGIDRWALARLSDVILRVTEHYNNFEFHRAYRVLHDFCAVELSSFYFDCLKDRLYTFDRDSEGRRSAQTVLYEILTSLVRLSSPIIPHTAEEAWQHLAVRDRDVPSIFLAGLPAVKKEYINKKITAKWEKILIVRGYVTKVLELARSKDMIGNSLEAKVLLYPHGKEFLKIVREMEKDWREILIVSAVCLCNEQDEIKRDGVNADFAELSVGVERAPGNKCVRCWNWSETTGKDSEHPQLCERCVPVVRNSQMKGEKGK